LTKSLTEDLSADLIWKVKPILNAQKHWEAARPNNSLDNLPLKVQLPRDYSNLPPTEAVATTTTVDIRGWAKSNLYPDSSYGVLHRPRPIMCVPWTTFTFRFHLNVSDASLNDSKRLKYFLWRHLLDIQHYTTYWYLVGYRRIILCLEDCNPELDDKTPYPWYQERLVTEEPTPDECKEWIRHNSIGGGQAIEFGSSVSKWANLNDDESDYY
jgi:hypothetical protein